MTFLKVASFCVSTAPVLLPGRLLMRPASPSVDPKTSVDRVHVPVGIPGSHTSKANLRLMFPEDFAVLSKGRLLRAMSFVLFKAVFPPATSERSEKRYEHRRWSID
jgi:hypothetical protein